MQEGDYRRLIQELFDRVEKALDRAEVDPDVLEVDQSQGALTLRFGSGARCILSAQPSVRQLWMAVAARGEAFHFVFDPAQGKWLDDKGRGIDPLTYLASYIQEAVGITVSF